MRSWPKNLFFGSLLIGMSASMVLTAGFLNRRPSMTIDEEVAASFWDGLLARQLFFSAAVALLMAVVFALQQVPNLSHGATWALVLAAPSATACLVLFALSFGEDDNSGFLGPIWGACSIPVCGWVFILFAFPALCLSQPFFESHVRRKAALA